jgi:uncharacterized cupin superfamily protein
MLAALRLDDRQCGPGRITTHYCAPELARLLEGANRISERDQQRPELVVLRRMN